MVADRPSGEDPYMRRNVKLWVGVAAVGALMLVGSGVVLLTLRPAGQHGTRAGGGTPGSANDGGTDLLGSGGPSVSPGASPSPGGPVPPGGVPPTKGAGAPPVFAHPGVVVSRAQLDF